MKIVLRFPSWYLLKKPIEVMNSTLKSQISRLKTGGIEIGHSFPPPLGTIPPKEPYTDFAGRIKYTIFASRVRHK